MKKALLFAYLFVSSTLFSQVLEANDIKASINNNGILFNQNGTQSAGYEVPKGSALKAIYAASLWCAAEDANGSLRLAAMRFGQQGNDFFPGPYSSTNDYTSSNYTSEYGTSIWQLTYGDIQNHIANYSSSSYVMPTAIATWPGNGVSGVGVAQNLAPFIDMNGNGIYEPLLGDYPDIRGDAAIYTIMNDAAGLHTETGGQIMGIEVHTMAYQYLTNDYRNRTTYLHYRVFNRGTIGYQNFRLGMWWDPDLGNPSDDYVGCDTLKNMMYVYNADNNDENSGPALGYGLNPPALGISSLTKKMEYFTYFTNGNSFPYTDPSSAAQYYNYMNGFWANGEQMYYGGTGAASSPGSTTITTNYLFPGNPNIPYEWSESDTVYGVNQPGDRRGVMTLEAESLPSGGSSCYDFAVLYAREVGNNHKQNVNALKNMAALAKTDFDAMANYNCNLYTLSSEELTNQNVGLYPNPNKGEFNITFEQTTDGTIQITDMSGRIVFNKSFTSESNMKIELDENPGIFILSISTKAGTIYKKIIVE